MPGIVRFVDPKGDAEGDLLGTPVLDSRNRISSVTPLSGITDGEWIEVKGYGKVCLSLIVDTSATAVICGSMAVAKPANSYDGHDLFGTQVYAAAAEEIFAVTTPIRWLKVKVTANGGLISAPFIGIKE